MLLTLENRGFAPGDVALAFQQGHTNFGDAARYLRRTVRSAELAERLKRERIFKELDGLMSDSVN